MPTRAPILCRRLFLFAVGLTVLVAAAPVAAYKPPKESALDDFAVFDESKGEKWKELEVPLPAFPDDRNLIPVRMPAAYTLKVYLDEKSISRAPDGIARYTLVVDSP